MFYKKININGTEYPLAVNITGSGAPTENTEATVGMFYMDEDNGDVYKKTANGWEKFGETGRTLVINTQEEWDKYFVQGEISIANPLYIIVNCSIQLSGNFKMPEYMTHLMLDFRNNAIWSETTVMFDGSWDYGRAGVANTVKNARFENVIPQYFKKMETCIINADVYTCNNMHNCEIAGTAYGCTGIIGCTAKGVQYCNTVLLNSYDGVTMSSNTNVIGG